MILGLSISAFTLLHVALSLIGILSGAVVLGELIQDRQLDGWTALLGTTVATCVTGFLFPSTGFDAARVIGVISLVALAIALIALYGLHFTDCGAGSTSSAPSCHSI